MRFCYRIKDSWWNFRSKCQRFKRGYSWGDVWDMDQWFMNTIKPMLIHLRDHGIGCPNEFYDEANDSDEAWKNILTEMINCLEMMDEDNVRSYLGFGDVEDWKRMTREDYINVHKIMNDNKNSFFRLFSEYFYDLWD